MAAVNLAFASYVSILFGFLLIIFNKDLAELYEKLSERNGSAFPRFITTTRLKIGGVVFIGAGIARLV